MGIGHIGSCTVLVTGARGVLGSYTRLLLSGMHPKRLLTPSREELDLLSTSSTHSYIEEHRPDIVIHLAATVYGLGGNLANPLNALTCNTVIDNNLFRALDHYPAKHIFFASTVAGYPCSSGNSALGLREDDFFTGFPHEGEYGYAMAKRHAYSYLQLLKKVHGTSFNYGIFTNLYGRYDRFDTSGGHVLPSLVAKARVARVEERPLTVWGNPESTRDFMHAADAAGAILHLITLNRDLSIVNISTGKETAIGEIAKIIADENGLDSITYDPGSPVGISRRVVDNSRLLGTGFQSAITLDYGIRDLVGWYSDNLTSARR
jgi:GDP-L-fucose synthase